MKALQYLLRTIIKNRIFSLRKKPAFLILYLIIFASILFVLISSGIPSESIGQIDHRDIRIIYAIIAGICFIYMLSFITNGLSSGSTLFSMADVGFLFTSPVSPKKILIYGLVKQMGTAIFSAIFILYQVYTLRETFNFSLVDVFNLFVIDVIVLFFCQLLSVAIYVYANGNPTRKKLVIVFFSCIVAALLAVVWIQYMQNSGTILEIILKLTESKLFQLIPVAGWAVMFFSAAMLGNMFYILVSLLLFFLCSVLIIAAFTSGEADYYEDVLHSTEVMHRKLQDAKNGKATTFSKVAKVKEDKTGIKKGSGYAAIFYKHMLEKKRTSRFIFIDNYTLLVSIGGGIAAKIIDPFYSGYVVLAFLIYLQFFATMLSKLSMELSRPYIFMIPEKSIHKVIAASLTTIIKPFIDGIIIFTVVCIVSKTSPVLNIFLALAYASTGCFFTGFQLLCQRILGGMPNKLAYIFTAIFLFFLLLGPGIVLSIIAINMLPQAFIFAGTLPYTLSGLIIAGVTLAFCGDLLDKSELSTELFNL